MKFSKVFSSMLLSSLTAVLAVDDKKKNPKVCKPGEKCDDSSDIEPAHAKFFCDKEESQSKLFSIGSDGSAPDACEHGVRFLGSNEEESNAGFWSMGGSAQDPHLDDANQED